jgi:N-acetylglutamate synthase-like GNAT family acetyltransferase
MSLSLKYRSRKVTKNSRVLDDVADLDWLCYNNDSLSKKELVVLLENGHICEIVETTQDKKLIGAIIYQVTDNKVSIASLSVHPEYERIGVGSKMLANVSSKMGKFHSGCYFQVPESVIQNCVFLVKNGFIPVKNGSSTRNGKTYFLFALSNPFFSEMQVVTKDGVNL